MNKISIIATSKFRLPLKVYKSYHDAILVVITIYATRTWAYRLKLVRPSSNILQIQRKTLIMISCAFSSTATDALTSLLGIIPIDLEVRKRAAKHWLKKDNQEKIREIIGREARCSGEINERILDICAKQVGRFKNWKAS